MSQSRRERRGLFLALMLFVAPNARASSTTGRRVRTIVQDHSKGNKLTRGVGPNVEHSNVENAFTGSRRTTFKPVMLVSAANILANVVRPDPDIIWQAKIPRVLWELCIFAVANIADSPDATPASYLLLSMMTASTALVDIFIWAPSFALFAEFETCEGGGWFSREPRVCHRDYVKGLGRLFVSAQSILTGVFYLMTSIVAWGAFTGVRDRQLADRNAESLRSAFLLDKHR